jgi:hypothetical protein
MFGPGFWLVQAVYNHPSIYLPTSTRTCVPHLVQQRQKAVVAGGAQHQPVARCLLVPNSWQRQQEDGLSGGWGGTSQSVAGQHMG